MSLRGGAYNTARHSPSRRDEILHAKHLTGRFTKDHKPELLTTSADRPRVVSNWFFDDQNHFLSGSTDSEERKLNKTTRKSFYLG